MVEKIKKLCDSFGITVHALEKELKLSNGTITRWDKNRPSVDKIAAVARFFGEPIEYFLD